ncbi:MAG TPA: hypothetical protein VKR60_05180 [Candidatus Sulfotelmatobacter sp.]|nr:hypothetical protein [Candidatus Sulfotelmatobacter sp.]
MIKRVFAAIVLSALAVAMMSCSNGKPPTGVPATPGIAGTWEFLAVSSNGGGTTGIEVALQEGSVLINGMPEPSGIVSAAGISQIAFVCINSNTGDVISFGGNCPGQSGVCSMVGGNTLNGTARAIGGPFTFTYTENGNAFTVSGMLDSQTQGLVLVNGTYNTQTSGTCTDSGSVTGVVVPKLTGTYTGQMTLPDGTADSVTATLSQSSGNLTVGIVGTGSEPTSFSLTGPVTGHAFALQGQFNVGGTVQPITYNGYYQLTKGIPSIYFVNSTDTANPAYAGTLTLQPQQ